MPRILVNKNRVKKAPSIVQQQQQQPVVDEVVIGDAVCAVCEVGGGVGSLLDTCDGCARSWHIPCLELSSFPGGEFIHPGHSKPPLNDLNDAWLCDDCELRLHRCYLCKHYSHDESLYRCTDNTCCKYYHDECLNKYKKEECLNNFISLPSDQKDQEKSSKCPRHEYCGNSNTECLVKTSSSYIKLDWRCIRCPISYHTQCKPLDIHVVDYSHHLFLCIKHVLDSSKKLPEPNSIQLLYNRKRLKLTQFNSLDDFLKAEEAKKVERRKNYIIKEDKDEDVTPSSSSPSPRSSIIKIKKKVHKTCDLKPNIASNTTLIKGTRMKIRGYNPNRLDNVDLLRTGSKSDRLRRQGFTGQCRPASMECKRGSKERVNMMKWVAAQMKAYDNQNSDIKKNNDINNQCNRVKEENVLISNEKKPSETITDTVADTVVETVGETVSGTVGLNNTDKVSKVSLSSLSSVTTDVSNSMSLQGSYIKHDGMKRKSVNEKEVFKEHSEKVAKVIIDEDDEEVDEPLCDSEEDEPLCDSEEDEPLPDDSDDEVDNVDSKEIPSGSCVQDISRSPKQPIPIVLGNDSMVSRTVIYR